MTEFTDEQTRTWRASYLRGAAKRLDKQIENMKQQAKHYRETADRIEPKRSHQGFDCNNTDTPDGCDGSPF